MVISSIKPPELISVNTKIHNNGTFWTGDRETIFMDSNNIKGHLYNLQQPVWIVQTKEGVGLSHSGNYAPPVHDESDMLPLLAKSDPISITQFGDPSFCKDHQVVAAYYTGAMANAIASEKMVIELGKSRLLGSFGAAGLSLERLEKAINTIQAALPQGPYAFNLIHNPFDQDLEQKVIELYLKYGISTIETAAFLKLTPNIVAFKASGLGTDQEGNINNKNRIIAKISRKEVATQFLQPAPDSILSELVSQGRISEQQANLAKRVPVANDITVEADSGGHTDNRPLVCLLPTIIALRNEMQRKYEYDRPVRVGAGGGISTPDSALAAYMMGAAYIVTGSVNHACVESGASEHTKNLLAKADMADVSMAPSADMFEMGVKVQVLKKGTLYPMRAQKLYELYTKYNSIETIPDDERDKLEAKTFQKSLESVWQETTAFFRERDPKQLQQAQNDPKRKMALIFRWYLGLSSHWSVTGEKGRKMDYQIWCGPSMGTFNDWVRGTYLEKPENRYVVDIARHILRGCSYRYRIQQLQQQGISLPAELQFYSPENKLI